MTDPDPDKTHDVLPNSPTNWMVSQAIVVAKESPCRSKRGVVIYDPSGMIVGSGWNSPPEPFGCPGRNRCQGKCGQLAVHAEARALRSVAVIIGRALELVHVELAIDGKIIACNGPSCVSCSKEILDARSIAGIWLYEIAAGGGAAWRRYSAVEFHRIGLERCGLPS